MAKDNHQFAKEKELAREYEKKMEVVKHNMELDQAEKAEGLS